jgi:hypothetical protein
LGACNWVPRPKGRHGSPDFADSGGAFGWGGGGARPRAHLGHCGGRSWGGGVAGEGARQGPAVPAAADCGSGERGATPGNAWHGAVLPIPREVLMRAVAKRASMAAAC